MHWLILGFGCLMAAAGGVSLWSSIDLIGVERGNVLAVGGAVAVAGGAVVVALGLVLLRLEAIARHLATRLGELARPASLDQPAPLAQPAAPARIIAPESAPLAMPLAAAVASQLAPASTWAVRTPPQRAAEDGGASEPPEFLRRPELAVPAAAEVALARPETLRPPRPDALVLSMLEQTDPPAPVLPVIAQPAIAPPPVAAAPQVIVQQAATPPKHVPAMPMPEPGRLFPGRDPLPEPAAAPPYPDFSVSHQPAAELPHHGDDDAWFVPQELPPPPHAAPAAPLPVAAHPVAAPPAPEVAHAAPPLAPEPEVIGRYNAGGAAYIMYSDGSIEAETENGTYRFASMNELREFIEHRLAPTGA